MKRNREAELQAIEEVLQQSPDDLTAREIAEALEAAPPHRTLQDRLKALVDANRLTRDISGRRARYRMPKVVSLSGRATAGIPTVSVRLSVLPPLSQVGAEIREYVQQPPQARQPVGYHRSFLEYYRPNQSFYLSEEERAQLAETGTSGAVEQAAGAYAKQILNRLLIDLSWNSSRLEGNT